MENPSGVDMAKMGKSFGILIFVFLLFTGKIQLNGKILCQIFFQNYSLKFESQIITLRNFYAISLGNSNLYSLL